MTLYHAVAFVDHHTAQVLQFDAGQVLQVKLHRHHHMTRQHGSDVRSEHEFFGEVCDALEGITEVLLTGGHKALADFVRYTGKHRPRLIAHIAGQEVVDKPGEAALVALARTFFTRHDRMTGIKLPD